MPGPGTGQRPGGWETLLYTIILQGCDSYVHEDTNNSFPNTICKVRPGFPTLNSTIPYRSYSPLCATPYLAHKLVIFLSADFFGGGEVGHGGDLTSWERLVLSSELHMTLRRLSSHPSPVKPFTSTTSFTFMSHTHTSTHTLIIQMQCCHTSENPLRHPSSYSPLTWSLSGA